ncbi:uncharacterized protein LOC118419347 [Branchiostoma floridae]|uniref:Uncharacterized protein LOC118419347 n=1 Tax=Branchiostoma floridae TaxID=7739 RepID=A0A9J7MUF7_BRAFL|nr:uncharacterized protein LOC118419347 [Branchiostoma floridae]
MNFLSITPWPIGLSPPSFSFIWTVGVQFFEGLLDGTLGVAKTYLYEICPPKFHSLAFSIIGMPFSVTHFVGPVLGGFLACPATRFPMFDKPLFKQFPYLLPCAVVACLQLILLIVGCIFLGESLDKKPKADYISLTQMSNHEVGEEDKEKPHRELLRDRLVLMPCALYALFALAHICCDQLLPLLLVSDSQHGGYNFDAAEISIVLTVGHIYSTAAQATLNPFLASKFTYKTVYMWGVALYAVGIVMLPSMVDITGAITSQEVLKVSNQTANSSGVTLNFTADSEYLLVSPSVTESHIQPTVRSRQPHEVANQTANSSDFTLTSKADSAYLSTSAPVTESYIHPISQRSSTSPLYVVVTKELNTTVERPLTGQCRLAGDRRRTSQHSASEVPARVWGPLLSVIMMMEQGKTLTYLAAIVMVGNAGVQTTRGTVNGIAQTLAALSRLVGPAVSANLFAWTTDNGMSWPMDHHLTFYLLTVLCLLVMFLCTRLPASCNLPRPAPGRDGPTVSGGGEREEEEEEEEGNTADKLNAPFRKSGSKTWIGGVDDKDDFETNHLLPSVSGGEEREAEEEEEEAIEDELRKPLRKSDNKTWINGVDDKDDFETNYLLASNNS